MRLLFITTQFPYPMDNGGKIGAYNGICVVSSQYNVTVLSFTEESNSIDDGIDYFSKKLPNVKFDRPITHNIHIRKKPFILAQVMMKNYIKNLPYVTAKFENKQMYKKIDYWFSDMQYWDIVFIDYLNMNVYSDYIRNKYKGQYGHLILKDHNIEYAIIKQEAFSSKGIKRAILNIEWQRTLKYESLAIKKSELVFSVCDDNTNFLKKYNNNSWTMLPTYEILPTRSELSSKRAILYIGNLSWKANIDGLQWFVKEVFPIIRKQISDVSLTIVGSGLSQNPFKGIQGVNYLGYLKDISAMYVNHRVFIVPLFEGSGIRIKILEAFNHEIAVVSTKLACETIGAQSGKELYIADTINEFAEATILLLENSEKNNNIRLAGKQYLKDKFSLSVRQDEFSKIISKTFGDYI